MRLFLSLIFLVSLLNVGCSSTRSRKYESVSIGMDKAQVLEIIGNPSRSDRARGSDRWSYDEFGTGDKEVVTVYFTDGKVSFVGTDEEFASRLLPKKQKPADGNFKEL